VVQKKADLLETMKAAERSGWCKMLPGADDVEEIR
jgi:hypothetical protein